MSRYAAVVLAAGQGSRFRASGGDEPSKLVAQLAGVPLVRHAVSAALASSSDPVVVVTGHAAGEVEAALRGLDLVLVPNDDFALGLASSLKAGIDALPEDVAGAVVLLGDMPFVEAEVIDRLVAAAQADPCADAVVPTFNGRRGNPVLLARSLWAAIRRLEGDAGARRLLQQPGLRVLDCDPGDGGVSIDVDDASDLARAVARAEATRTM